MKRPRREFMRSIASGGASAALCSAFMHFDRRVSACENAREVGFGPLREVIDESTAFTAIVGIFARANGPVRPFHWMASGCL